jgi:hypothetical protein
LNVAWQGQFRLVEEIENEKKINFSQNVEGQINESQE